MVKATLYNHKVFITVINPYLEMNTVNLNCHNLSNIYYEVIKIIIIRRIFIQIDLNTCIELSEHITVFVIFY